MTLPKKQIRKITVDGEEYLWQLSQRFETRTSWIVIQHSHQAHQLLCLNSYSHDLPIGPNIVAEAIRFALRNGWAPHLKAAPMYLDYRQEQFAIIEGNAAEYLKNPPDAIQFTGPSHS